MLMLDFLTSLEEVHRPARSAYSMRLEALTWVRLEQYEAFSCHRKSV